MNSSDNKSTCKKWLESLIATATGSRREREDDNEDIEMTHMNIGDVVAACANEITKLSCHLKSRKVAARDNLPYTIRRRAASHNVKRLPRSVREKIKRSYSNVKTLKRPSRRYRRRPRNLQETYAYRQENPEKKWTPTHIWHAKRFKMINKWKWSIPLRCNDKCRNAISRNLVTNGVVMIDLSFHQILTTTIEKPDVFMKSIEMFMFGWEFEVLQKCMACVPNRCTITLLSHDKSVVGPIEFIFFPSECSSQIILWAIIHPAIYNAAEHLFRRFIFDGVSDRIPISRFRLIGPSSSRALSGALRMIDKKELTQVNIDTSGSGQKKKWWYILLEDKNSAECNDKFYNKRDVSDVFANLPPNKVTPFICRDPRVILPKAKKYNLSDNLKISDDTPENNSDHSRKSRKRKGSMKDAITLPGSPPDISFSHTLFSSNLQKHLADTSNLTPTHEINSLRTKLKLLPFQMAPITEGEDLLCTLISRVPGAKRWRLPVSRGDGCDSDGIDWRRMTNFSNDLFLPMHFGNGFDLFIPQTQANFTWINLIYQGVKPIGLKDWQIFHTDMGVPYFPSANWIDTKAGRDECKSQALESRKRWDSLPPAKRVNFVKGGIDYPFLIDWKDHFKRKFDIIKDAYNDGDIHPTDQSCVGESTQVTELSSADAPATIARSSFNVEILSFLTRNNDLMQMLEEENIFFDSKSGLDPNDINVKILRNPELLGELLITLLCATWPHFSKRLFPGYKQKKKTNNEQIHTSANKINLTKLESIKFIDRDVTSFEIVKKENAVENSFTLISVRMMMFKGVPSRNALICIPTAEDIFKCDETTENDLGEKLRSRISYCKKKSKIGRSITSSNNSQKKKSITSLHEYESSSEECSCCDSSDNLSEIDISEKGVGFSDNIDNNIENVKKQHDIIGYVTDGQYSTIVGKSVGIGVVYLQDYLRTCPLCLIRNIDSYVYNWAYVLPVTNETIL